MAIKKPTPNKTRGCLGDKVRATLARHKINPTTMAVTELRTAIAVVTSTPCANAKRAATWLAPIKNAIRRRVAKAVRERRNIYSALILLSVINFEYLAFSAAKNTLNSAGDVACGSTPSPAKRSFKSGLTAILANVAL